MPLFDSAIVAHAKSLSFFMESPFALLPALIFGRSGVSFAANLAFSLRLFRRRNISRGWREIKKNYACMMARRWPYPDALRAILFRVVTSYSFDSRKP